jgi:hypothetical protein
MPLVVAGTSRLLPDSDTATVNCKEIVAAVPIPNSGIVHKELVLKVTTGSGYPEVLSTALEVKVNIPAVTGAIRTVVIYFDG